VRNAVDKQIRNGCNHCVVKIPIIAIFTKYDLLVNQFFAKDQGTAQEKALSSFSCSVKELQEGWGNSSTTPLIPCVKVSMKEPDTEMFIDLTKVTRERLQDVEVELQVLWVAAQRVNARQKVEVSIR